VTPMQLASIFTVLDTHGVQDILRVQSIAHAFRPGEHITAVWVRPQDWASVFDSLSYEAQEPPTVRASLATTGADITLNIDAESYRVFCWWPLRDVAAVAERLEAAGVDQKMVAAWATLGGAA
jgi:hypothetical protein